MQPTLGEIVEGKITGITKFGAFVALPDGSSGLVHISEIANSFVNDISEHVDNGQTVKVKIIGISEAGKINLSIKQAQPSYAPAPPAAAPRPAQAPRQGGYTPRNQQQTSAPTEASFEDKLKQFMQDSDSRISDSRMYSEKKGGYRRKRD